VNSGEPAMGFCPTDGVELLTQFRIDAGLECGVAHNIVGRYFGRVPRPTAFSCRLLLRDGKIYQRGYELIDDILSMAAPKADARVAYGRDPNQFVDLRIANGTGPHAVAVCIHGGYWRAKYDLEYLGHLCAGLTARGITTANVEYRRVGNAGGGWPGTFADVRSAYQFVVQNAGRYRMDTKCVIVVGHSAGGQLALCLAAHEAVRAAVSLAGVVDLERAYELHLSKDAVVEFLGGTPREVGDHYREADPMRLAIRAPQYLLHGVKDEDVPPELSRNYAGAKAKENVRLTMIEGATHFDLVDPRSRFWRDVERIVMEAVS
jgi:acetyl esterase/lipase